MEITYNKTAKKFSIDCSFRENHLISDIPNKRFQKRIKLWHAPVLSRNADHMLTNLRQYMTPEAVAIAEDVVSRKKVRQEDFPSWYRFKTKPYDHQIKALNHSWALDTSAYFMEMGTGKTKTAIDLHAARFMTAVIDVWVVFCPNALRDNWADEIKIHSPLTDIPVFVIADMTEAKTRNMIKSAEQSERFVVVVGMESMQQTLRGGSAWKTLMGMVGDRKYALTVDESHNIKNPDANRSRNVEAFAEYAQSKLIMTGSPIAQGILDLYMPFQVLDPNIIGIGDYYSFKNRYAEFGGYENREIVGYRNVEELMSAIRPYVFQCTKEEALDLPEKIYMRRSIQMSKEQERVYKELHKESEAMIQDMKRSGKSVEVIAESVITKYGMLQQVTGGFLNYKEEVECGDEEDDIFTKAIKRTTWLVEPLHNPKIKEVIDIAEENPDKKIIIWAKFRTEIAMIVEALRAKYGDVVSEYHGGVSNKPSNDLRKANLIEFKTGKNRFFVANQQTGGTGLTINESNLVVYYSNSLKLVDRMQSEDRNHRIGQDKGVVYIDLVCTGTKDEDVLTAIRNKKDVADYVKENMR
jgi:SNF2 family DNA or RNA helicase